MSVNPRGRSGGIIRISFFIFLNMKVYCVFSLESPNKGDSIKYTKYTILNTKKEKQPNLSQVCSYEIFSKGLNHEFETAMVNKPSVFEPLKFYCILKPLLLYLSLSLNKYIFLTGLTYV